MFQDMVGRNTMLERQVGVNSLLGQDGCCNALESIVDNPMLLQTKLILVEVVVLVDGTTVVKVNRNNCRKVNKPGLDNVELSIYFAL